MTAGEITLEAMDERHLDDAACLSREAGWPHRREDWAFVLSVSEGIVALEGEAVVGTAIATLFDPAVAAINMVIVDERLRGRGLGRRLMDAAMARADGRSCRLTATQDGLPLYEKLGFEPTGEIVQHQGVAQPVTLPEGVEWATESDFPRLADLDCAAVGFRREAVISMLGETGRFAAIRENGMVEAFAARRPFGRGTVIGPIVARSEDEAVRLLDFLLAGAEGTFVRVDNDRATGLAPLLAERGLSHAGGGIAMRRGPAPVSPGSPYRTFALVNQALG